MIRCDLPFMNADMTEMLIYDIYKSKGESCDIIFTLYLEEVFIMKKHIKTLTKSTLKKSVIKGGCGECQTSCQSACKTSCTVANQECENTDR